MAKLTKRLIDALKPRLEGDLFVWDGELKGFGVRMKPSGAASFIVQYRTPQGRTRRFAFATVGVLTPEEGRAKARQLLAAVENGEDPSSLRHEVRRALTVAQLCDAYMEAARAGHVRTRFGRTKRRSTVAIDEGRVYRHIVPLLGNRIAEEVTRADVQRMCDSIAAGKTAATIKTKARGVARVTGGAGTATRVAGLLGGIFTWAEKRGLVKGPNPVRGLDLRADAAKDRVLSKEELRALGEAMQNAGSPMAASALRLIALTALRRGEAYGLRWREIDFEGSCLRLIETKAGRSTRPIGKAAIEHLRSLPKLHDEYVFPNRQGSGGADLQRQVVSIFNAAGLADARGHDLRRTFASAAAELGYSDATIGELIGHAKQGVTEKHYVRRPDAALVEAATRTADLIARALDGVEGEVIELRPGIHGHPCS
ncbi:MAG: tyrosine-type recombinase/integrase [Methylocystis sp.]